MPYCQLNLHVPFAKLTSALFKNPVQCQYHFDHFYIVLRLFQCVLSLLPQTSNSLRAGSVYIQFCNPYRHTLQQTLKRGRERQKGQGREGKAEHGHSAFRIEKFQTRCDGKTIGSSVLCLGQSTDQFSQDQQNISGPN